MTKALILVSFLLAFAGSAAYAQLLLGVSRANSGGGSPIPPACTGTLNLAEGCALTVVLGLGP